MDQLLPLLSFIARRGEVRGEELASEFPVYWPRLLGEADGLVERTWGSVGSVPRATDWTIRVTLVGELFLTRHS